MTTKFSQVEYETILKDFVDSAKRILVYKSKTRDLSKNEQTLKNYRTSIVKTYNILTEYITKFYSRFDEDSKETLRNRLKFSRAKVVECFQILSIEYNWPEDRFASIDLDLVSLPRSIIEKRGQSSKTQQIDESSDEYSDTNTSDTERDDNQGENLLNTSDILTVTNTENNFLENRTENNTTNVNMPQTKPEFLKLAASIINYKFGGDPLKLESFLTDVELITDLAEADNKQLCVKFVKAKLEGRALECLPEQVTEIEHITDALRARIKPENSSVVEGKMMALRVRKGNFTDFAEQAEKLAESLQRTLIVEGISKEKAKELSIRKTVELCRKTARNDIVKSVLSSSIFASPSEAIAKLITENDLAQREKKELENFKQKSQRHDNGRKFERKQVGGRPQFNSQFNRRNGPRSQTNRRYPNRSDGPRTRNNNQDRNSTHRSNRPTEHTIRVRTER